MSKGKKGRRIAMGVLAVLLSVSLLPVPELHAEDAAAQDGGAQAGSGDINIESKNNVVPNFKAGETKEWVFTVTNHTGVDIQNVVVQPDMGNSLAEWPFQTEQQKYAKEIPQLAEGEQQEISFAFTQREDVKKSRYTIQLAVSADGVDKNLQKFYVNTMVKEKEETNQKTDKSIGSGEGSPAGGFSNGDAVYSGGGGSDSASVPRVIVTGFSTSPDEVRAGSDFTLTIHLKNTSGSSGVKNMLFDLSSPTEGADEQTMAPAFLPASGSSSIYLEGIGAGETADISINLNAKADLLQKPYSVDVLMQYEDSNSAQIEAKSSLSIPVKQDARFELSDFEVSPQNIEVGEEANVMCSLYNLGRIKLYNVKATFEGACIEKEEIFIGNVESGAQAAIDAMLKGKKETKGPAKITMTLSYEDEAGKVSEKKEELQLEVVAIAEDAPVMSEVTEETGGLPIVPIFVILGMASVVVAAVMILKKKKKAKREDEEEALLDELYRSSEDERE